MKTLKQALAEYSEEQLKQLASWWGIGDAPEEGWRLHYGLMIQRMQDPVALRFAWEQINENERKLLHNMLNFSTSNSVLHDVIHKITRLPEAEFEQALATLKQYMLVIEEQATVKYAGATTGSSTKQKNAASVNTTKLSVAKEMLAPLLSIANEIYSPEIDRTQIKLENILARFNQDRLYEIGRLYGFMLHDYYSRTLPSVRLVGQMVQPDVALYAWEHFDAKTRRLLKWLCDNDGVATMQDVREFTGFDNSELSVAIHELEKFAIAFDAFLGTERQLFVPRELLKNLKKAVAQPEIEEDALAPGMVILDTPPQSIQKGDTLVLYDMATILGAMFQQNIEPTQSSRVPKRIANKLLPAMQVKIRTQPYYEGDDTVDMLFSVAQELGFVKLSKSTADSIKPRFIQGSQFDKWSHMNVVDQTHSLLNYWLEGHPWIDVAGVDVDQNDNYYDSYYLDILAGRKAVMSYVNTCTPGQWYSMSSLLRTMKDHDPYVLRPRYAAMGVSGYRSNRNMLANWYKLDGQIILGMLSSTLHELGMITLGYQRPHVPKDDEPVNPDAFMLTDLAAAVLQTKGETTNTAIPTNERSLIVQPSFELLLLQPDLQTVYSLLPFALVNQVGIVSRLTLTKQSVLRGLEAGRNIGQIIKILEDHSQKELPQNVVYTLRDWTKSYKEVTISQVLLIEVPDEAIANEICSSSKFSALGLRRIGPCAIAVDSDTTLANVRRAFDKEGIVVRINGDIITKSAAKTTYRGRY